MPFLVPVDTTLYRPESGELVFVHQTENGEGAPRDSFRGYDLFYKLYENTNEVSQLVEDDINFITDDPAEPGTTRILARNFLRLYPEASPLIPISPDAGAIEIVIDVVSPPIGQNKEMTIRWPSGSATETVTIRRASSAEGTGKPIEFEDAEWFWSNDRYTSSDYDVQKSIGTLPEGVDSVVVLFCVLAYGVDGTFKPFYSEPTIFVKEVTLNI